jgi:hypothetical protein
MAGGGTFPAARLDPLADDARQISPWLTADATLWSEEEHPGLKVIGEFLKPVRDAGSNEQEVALPERHALFASAEHPVAGSDDVGFVLIVRLLRVGTSRREQFDRKISALE